MFMAYLAYTTLYCLFLGRVKENVYANQASCCLLHVAVVSPSWRLWCCKDRGRNTGDSAGSLLWMHSGLSRIWSLDHMSSSCGAVGKCSSVEGVSYHSLNVLCNILEICVELLWVLCVYVVLVIMFWWQRSCTPAGWTTSIGAGMLGSQSILIIGIGEH